MVNRREFLATASAIALLHPVRKSLASRASDSHRAKLLLVHGRSQQGKDPMMIKREWLAALSHGAGTSGMTLPDEREVDLPYYGDILDRFTRAFNIPLTSDVVTRGTAVDDEFLDFQAEFAEAVRQRAGVTDDEIDKEYGNDPRERGPLNWKWVQAILRAIDKHGSGMSINALETFTRDVFLYATRPGVRDEIDQVVASALTEQPTVIVGHSLGSVVAYSILKTDRRHLRVPLFVTVGSPLAVRAVRNQFRPLRAPPVDAWYNAYDTRDVVALYPLDEDNFPIRPAVQNNSSVKNSTDNRHGIAGYLDNPDVAKRILGALG